MGLLDGQIAQLIFNGFKGRLLPGNLRIFVDAGTLDEKGDPVSKIPTTYSCEGFIEEYSEKYRAQAGIPETDLAVNIFAKSLPANVNPAKDSLALFSGQWYQLRTVH